MPESKYTGDVADALGGIEKKQADLKQAGTHLGARRHHYHSLLNRLEAFPAVVNKLYSVHEYAVNECMGKYVKEFLNHKDAVKLRQECERELRAEKAPFKAPQKFEFSNEQWQWNKRLAAWNGILDTSSFSLKATGMKACIEEAIQAEDALNKFIKSNYKNAQMEQDRRNDAFDAWQQVRNLANGLKAGTDNAEFKKYMDAFIDHVASWEREYVPKE